MTQYIAVQPTAEDSTIQDHDDAATPGRVALSRLAEPVRVPIEKLLPADSPRLAGEDANHARTLAESEAQLPPILVHRRTMRVIDGMHRLRAAQLRGRTTIEVQFFDGPEDAFVIAVELNIRHGLPLSLADREAAAARIVGQHPEWSDRAIAAATGLAAKTVGAIRARVCVDHPQPSVRMGRDGRVRPLNAAEGRLMASEVIANRPDASLREIAKVAGISPATARDVRDRLHRGEDPIPPKQRVPSTSDARANGRSATRLSNGKRTRLRDRTALITNLRKDPSLRFTESGRALLRWLDAHASAAEGWEELLPVIPVHCAYVVAELAQGCANEWLEFAEQLKELTRATA